MTKPTEAPTEYDAMMAAGIGGVSATASVSCHCRYRDSPRAQGQVPECAVKLANGAGTNTACSFPEGTEETCATATGWQAEPPPILLFEDIE